VADEPQADRDPAEDADRVESNDLGDGAENPLDVEAEIAADYLEELLDIADLDGDIDTYIEGDRAHVSIVSDSHVLVVPKVRSSTHCRN
jgi:spoIIIJ-associated protein